MKINTRGMLSIIVILTLALSFALPFMAVSAALTAPNVTAGDVQPGDVIWASGTAGDVTSGATVKVYWDIATGVNAWLLNTTTGLSDGSYEVQVTVPETPTGNHYVWVEDSATKSTAKSIAVPVIPLLDVDPSAGLPDESVTLTGTGFSAESGFNVSFFNSTDVYAIIIANDEETDEYGSFSISVDVPSPLDYGDFWFNVTDNTTDNETVAFKVGALITLTPDEGPRKTVITIMGRGFSESEVIVYGDIKFDGSPVNITGDVISVDSDGEFTCEIIIGNLPYGVHIVNVSDGYYWATATFNVLRNQIDISLYSPENVAIGSIVEVNGVLRWDNGTGLGDRNLLVSYRLVYGTQWNELSVIQTDVNGSFKVQWIPQATGEFLLNFELVDGLDNWVDRNRTQIGLVVSEVVASGFQLDLSAGWNMVSSFDREVIAEDVFPGFFQLVTWNGQGYVSVDVMEPGKGYWALVLEDTNITITG